ncbi:MULTISPECIES: tRNA (adenosine(37)-N6)-threonylcarbamoyltransferase complex transferase subunit TsaD [Mesonia]|uniref:tRNA N6-adenosine threonylcarbamoyltransferase n=1 Tax=Mesonia oceanica TaxID=2687242 RepID=A0AC61Y4M8_9FLAO|nr:MULTISPECIES: tRNA (adenosine(37)-N6)-threonylcarbamoyltransferase complex transferase subunit TsaD [Mesonia]MAN26550.1 tRNA (adenosine(37)-N6)-threonylcarbamoyltransferase complex transferase subunit TsaD [Mesonia sp.]MAQ40818.1 tRNA (adenosine(37)-N6)-threonylcarbamoyltransferase complex transferase subunit TsaD [Mesonia sp.]MBJ97739.1 tRNA (adenosine(37)-N6)-threonylcarbamoyltransferase complex transferase subunit TsaD [Flavobacteriaceae bacterium]VVU99445.1 tRNA N6-adenosine threonylcarb|tara:strand:- start:3343 stop:4365 length:1023 start_codon:yes stop_codon:yes gene_type:complete
MDSQNIYILGIESSCDDTAAAVLCNGKIKSNVVATQKIHEEYGGVVPELASRAHQQNIVPVIHQAIEKAGIKKEDLSAIAFTRGPGLMGSLLVGTSFAKSMAAALKIPLIEVNHMQAHILAHFIEEEDFEKPNFPFLGLTISGGHTQIVKVSDFFKMEVIGETLDDAVGEAYDKCGKMLNLPYPGGPLIDKYAKEGNPKAFPFPKPNVKNLDFSFSGLKTSMLYFLEREEKKNPDFIEENLKDICASFQYTVVKILMDKLKKAVKQTGVKEIAIGGGVSANSGIRTALIDAQERFGWKTYIPKFEYTTDNAAMIAIVGHYKYLNKEFSDASITAQARYSL